MSKQSNKIQEVPEEQIKKMEQIISIHAEHTVCCWFSKYIEKSMYSLYPNSKESLPVSYKVGKYTLNAKLSISDLRDLPESNMPLEKTALNNLLEMFTYSINKMQTAIIAGLPDQKDREKCAQIKFIPSTGYSWIPVYISIYESELVYINACIRGDIKSSTSMDNLHLRKKELEKLIEDSGEERKKIAEEFESLPIFFVDYEVLEKK